MKLTKLLAMLLALCMIICCFAACGGSDDDDDDDKDEKVEDKEKDEDEDEDDDKSDKDDEDEDEDKSNKDDEDEDKPSKQPVKEDAELEGRWKSEIDLGAFLLGADEDMDVPELMFGIVFEFRNGNYTSTAVDIPSEDELVDFLLATEPSAEREDAEQYAESLVEEIESDPRMIHGEYEQDGNVIVLDEMAEVTFEIDGNEMTFEEIDTEYSEYKIFEGVKFEKQ